MEELRHVVIVGRPNVGKSRLFNRLVGRRLSIVHDQPGVTRDVVSAEVDNDFTLLDTGGIGMKPAMTSEEIHEATEEQVDFAIQAASLILFVVDAQMGLTPQDHFVAETLRNTGKKILLIANKIDTQAQEDNATPFYALGFGSPLKISAEHNLGTDSLLSQIRSLLGPKPQETSSPDSDPNRRIRICFAGRPNVGKSSIANKLLKGNRLIVSDVPGTTRDAVSVDFDYQAPDKSIYPFQLIDTAGLRSKGKVDSSLEFFSGLRAHTSIENADVVFLVIDALDGITKQEKKLAGDILEAGRCLIIIVNKWDFAKKQFNQEPIDGYESEAEFRKDFARAIREDLYFLPASPIIFTSATEGFAMKEILRRAKAIYDRLQKKLTTNKINTVIGKLMEKQPPRSIHGKRFKIYYSVQVANNPYCIKVFCNQTMRLEDPYKRYLETGFNNAFQLRGCPVKFDFVGKPSRNRGK